MFPRVPSGSNAWDRPQSSMLHGSARCGGRGRHTVVVLCRSLVEQCSRAFPAARTLGRRCCTRRGAMTPHRASDSGGTMQIIGRTVFPRVPSGLNAWEKQRSAMLHATGREEVFNDEITQDQRFNDEITQDQAR